MTMLVEETKKNAQTRDRTADLLLTRQAQLPLCYPGHFLIYFPPPKVQVVE